MAVSNDRPITPDLIARPGPGRKVDLVDVDDGDCAAFTMRTRPIAGKNAAIRPTAGYTCH